jgi:hypothetical protein
MAGDGGVPITPAPSAVRLDVRMTAPDVAHERLRAMVQDSFRFSPVSAALESAVPVGLRIEIDPS